MTYFENFLDLQLTFWFLPSKVLSHEVTQTVTDLVKFLICDLHVQPSGL